MPTKPRKPDLHQKLDAGIDHLSLGFTSVSEAKVPFRRLHFHDDIEISINAHHPVVALFGGQRITLPPDHLVVFWAAQPHGPIETTPGGWAYGIHIPLPWVLQWELPSALMQRLLAGEVFIDRPAARGGTDLDLLRDWVGLLQGDSQEMQPIVLLEAEARLRRLAANLATRKEPGSQKKKLTAHSRGANSLFERMATFIATHYREPLTIADVAQRVEMTPAHAMRVFRRFSSMTIHEFLVQHRVSHAQRILSTTDETIDQVCAKSGFGSPARFYAQFKKWVGHSPSAYRRSFAENG